MDGVQQKMPKDFKSQPKKLAAYAKRFFGFGNWNADCWLIGIEERGAEDKREFSNRYTAWYKLRRPALVDLRHFTKKAEVPVNWQNPTWKQLHKLCTKAGVLDEPLCSCVWGNAKQVGRRHHVALIEAMPFPAKSTKEEEWPYGHWEPEFMKTRKACKNKFLAKRVARLLRKVLNEQPKVVIDYAGLWKEMWCSVEFCSENDQPFLTAIIGRTLWISLFKKSHNFPNETIKKAAKIIRETLNHP
jgi:hypothetical protein